MIVVIADGRNLTNDVSDLTYSTVDPGGFEACSFTIPNYVHPPAIGSRVLVLEGLHVLWEGMVEDPGATNTADQVSAVGYGSLLKDNPYRMIYVDCAISNWQTDLPLNEKIRLTGLGVDLGTMSWTTTNEGLVLPFPSSVTVPSSSEAGATYRAAPGCTVAKIVYRGVDVSFPNAGWVHEFIFTNADTTSTNVGLHNSAMDDAVHSFTPTSPAQFVYAVVNSNGIAAAPAAGSTRIFKNIGLYGDHGLTTRAQTGAPDGLFPVDVALHALSQQDTIVAGSIDTDANGYIAPHVLYADRTVPEQVIDDMSKLLGWHWGVWESHDMFGAPRLDFRARPSSPTCSVSRRDCDNLELTEQRSNIYDTCIVSYVDPDSTPHEVMVSIANKLVPGIGRTLVVDGGTNTATQAQALATTQLELAQSSQRGGGSPILPDEVMTGSGSRKAHTLRAGLDRLRITDLKYPRSTLDPEAQFDSFRISRTEVTVQNGAPQTTVEIDYGADLLEVLQARLTAAAAAAGIQ